ncbi:MAG: DUF971 domain-containing protein [Pseudomonadota bacterium]
MTPWPVELRFQSVARQLSISFDDGSSGTVAYRRLRQESPSAENKGHGAGPRPPQSPIPDDITVSAADPVGRYAIRIVFSDGHNSGLYTWSLLHHLCVSARIGVSQSEPESDLSRS